MSVDLLRGIRVVEFTHVWAGPLCGQVLADLGAEVIKVESNSHLDVHRRAGPYVGMVPGINRSGVWNAQNRGKLSCTLNISTERGRELAVGLVAISDIVIDNFTPGTLARRGLGFDDLARINPRLISVSLTGYGENGPWRDYPAYGPMMDAVGGLAWATEGAGGEPGSVNGWLPDTSAALYGVIAALSGLLNRDGSTAGEPDAGSMHYDVAELESTISLLPELFLLSLLDGDGFDPASTEAGGALFDATLPCAGHDQWLSLRVSTMDEWRVLQRVLGSNIGAPGRDSPTGRAAIREELARLTRGRHRDALCRALQSGGVEAVPVSSAADLETSEHLHARGAFATVQHDEVGPTRTYAPPLRPTGYDAADLRAAPVLGQHNRYVFTELLRLSPQEYRDLEQKKVLW